MKFFNKTYLWAVIILISGVTYVGCTHDDDIAPSAGTKIERGSAAFTSGVDKWKLDKTHSSVLWETAYMGSGGLLTGRFNSFGVTSMSFEESNPEKISFEGWVRLNTVNTGEPGRDGGCLLGTFGTAAGLTDEANNLATLKSKKVEFSKSDKGYIVTFDMTFMGKTKEITGKLNYVPKTTIPASGTAAEYNIFGLKLDYQFFAKSDFGIVSNSIADKVGVSVNMNFNNK
ncbi:MAG: YceI family protein [Hymenobacteraceae bacterium]|nr:YceI family protein [Hymenobacteraceae bacterium]MDX5397035.1 YceI family protein [Hymenobacteraceae bacterium]MDX5442424.1 YceI family protein [Hymenobacteraceae bacterium]MDX5513107.1 YceI family protein [Hymenobacteraceae bacterium]